MSSASKKDSIILLNESFNASVLNYILQNKEVCKAQMRNSCLDDPTYDPFNILEKYFKKSRYGSANVIYKQNNSYGRFFAVGNLSLQSLCREFRHSIAADYYVDIDIVNAHPVILAHLCHINNFDCPQLIKYITQREEKINEIININSDIDRETAKILFLSITNGGSNAYKNLKKKTPFLKAYKEEMTTVHKSFSKKNHDDYKKIRDHRKSNGINYNHEAAFVNTLLCDFENKILMVIYNFYEKPKNAVLCFDGIMLQKKDDQDYKIDKCVSHIYEKLNIVLSIKIKEMNEGFNIPQDIKQYDYQSHDEIDEDLINNLKSEKDKLNYVNKYWCYISDLDRYGVIAYNKAGCVTNIDLKEKKAFINNYEGLHKVIITDGKKTLSSPFYKTYFESSKVKYKNALIGEEKPGYLTIYPEFDFNYNLSSPDELRVEKAQPLIDHIKNILCDNDMISFNYVIHWMAHVIQHPTKKIKTALVVISKTEGTGKGIIFEQLMKKIIGRNYFSYIDNLQSIINFNEPLLNKSYIVFDEVEKTNIGFKLADRLKSLITEESILANKKYLSANTQASFCNCVFLSNNYNIVKISETDRRFHVLDVNDQKANNAEYFNILGNAIKDNEAVQQFVNYLYSLDADHFNFRVIPESKLKEEMRVINVFNSFKDNLINTIKKYTFDYQIKNDILYIPSSTLFDVYRKYCDSSALNNEYNLITFGRHVSTFYSKIKKHGNPTYKIDIVNEDEDTN